MKPNRFVYCLMLFSTIFLFDAPAYTAIIKNNALDAFTDLSSKSNNQAPTIEIVGRIGADAFTDINTAMGKTSLELLEKRAREVILAEPKSGLAHEVLGTVFFYSGHLEQAEAEFQTATKLEPKQSGPWTKLGIVQMELDKTANAEYSLKQAITLNPNNRVANQRLGLLYEYLNDDQQSINYLTKGMLGTSNDYLGVSLNLARLLNKYGRFPETISVLEPRIQFNANISQAHTLLGSAYLAVERYEKAQTHFARAFELTPDSKESALGLAIAQRRNQQVQAALATITPLIAKVPDWHPAYTEQAEILLQLNRFDEAQQTFDLAIKKGSNPAYVYQRLAEYYVTQKEPTKAAQSYQKILALDNAEPKIYAQLAELQRAQNNLRAALTTLEQGVKKYPESGYIHFRYGSELATLRRYPEALTALELANQLQPNEPSILRNLSLLQSKQENYSAAAITAEQLYRLLPSQTAEAIFYASALQANNQIQDAILIYQNALTNEPQNTVILNNLANALADNGKLAEAEIYARRANALLNNNGQLLDTLGWILYQQSRYREAAQILEQAANAEPTRAVILYHSGMAYSAIKEQAKAEAALEQALKFDPQAEWTENAKNQLKNLQ